MNKRVVLALLVLTMAAVLSVRPVRAALPVVPLVLEAVLIDGTFVTLPTTLATGGGAASAALWTGLATSLGAGISFLRAKDTQSGNTLTIPVKGAGSGTISVTPPTATATVPMTGASNPTQYYSVTNNGWFGATPAAACDTAAANTHTFGLTWTGSIVTDAPDGQPDCLLTSSSGGTDRKDVTGPSSCSGVTSGQQPYTFCNTASGGTCPAGYTQSGSSCSLTDARVAQSDSRVDVQRSAATYSHITADADFTASGAVKGNVSGDTVTVNGVDANGAPFSYSIKATSAGTDISQQVQTPTANGDSQVTQRTLRVDPQGNPTTTSQTTTPGSLTIDQSTHTTTTSQSSGTTAYVQEQPCKPGVADQRNCEKTQQEIKDALTKKEDKDKAADPNLLDDQTITQNMKGLFPKFGLSGWQVPSHASACPKMQFDLSMMDSAWNDIRIEKHCELFEAQRATLATIMDLAWMAIAIFIVLSA